MPGVGIASYFVRENKLKKSPGEPGPKARDLLSELLLEATESWPSGYLPYAFVRFPAAFEILGNDV